jgi:hypothetical protein
MEGFLFSGSALYKDAYLETDYTVREGRRTLVLRPGVRDVRVDRLLRRFRARSAAFITAFNPYSLSRGVIVNECAHRRLVSKLKGRNIAFVDGYGRGLAGDWPAERSVLAFGVSRFTAAAIGRRFRQNAIVFVRLGTATELLMLR